MTGERYTGDIKVGVRWTEVNRRDEIVGKEKNFSGRTRAEAEKKLERFAARVSEKANFIEFSAWLGM